MLKPQKNCAYIDGTNLYKGCLAEGFKIDYAKFRTYLKEKWCVKDAYIFIGFLIGNESLYTRFQQLGYVVIFKPTVFIENNIVKGNCDAELILHAVCDFYEKKYEKAVIVTSDGDFACLIHFLMNKEGLEIVLSPRDKKKCSSLLKKSGAKLTFLPEVKDSIS